MSGLDRRPAPGAAPRTGSTGHAAPRTSVPLDAPATLRILRLADAAATPWRNGGGTTRELLALPDAQDWQLRVSVADIARDGPFSAYPGVRRWFAVLEGAGVRLALPEGERRLGADDAPCAFDGADAPDCRLVDGPTRDLNLMLRGIEGGMVRVDDRPWSPAAGPCGLYAGVAGRCIAGGRSLPLAGHTLVWFDAPPATLRFVPDLDERAPWRAWWLHAELPQPTTGADA